jgi:RNA polymerase sigma factor (sigma-70 family)
MQSVSFRRVSPRSSDAGEGKFLHSKKILPKVGRWAFPIRLGGREARKTHVALRARFLQQAIRMRNRSYASSGPYERPLHDPNASTVMGPLAVTIHRKFRTETMMASDELLLQLRDVFEAYGPAIIRRLIRNGTRKADAEDILQQVAVVVIQLPDDVVIENLKNYCYGIAENLAAERRRREAQRDDKLRKVASDPASEQAPSALDEAMRHADELRKTDELWKEFIETFDPLTQEVYKCVELESMTWNATAAHCEISVKQVERILSKARRQVRDWMCFHVGRDTP